MDNLLTFLAGVVVSSVGYLIKRKLEKSSVLEDLEIQLKLLEINKQMKEQNVTSEELEKMRDRIWTGSPRISGVKDFAEDTPEFSSQFEMTQYAVKEYHSLQEELNTTIKALLSTKPRDWKKAFEQSQLSWLEYRTKQAQLASDQYKGGSIAPFIYVTEASSITRSRIGDLRVMLAP